MAAKTIRTVEKKRINDPHKRTSIGDSPNTRQTNARKKNRKRSRGQGK